MKIYKIKITTNNYTGYKHLQEVKGKRNALRAFNDYLEKFEHNYIFSTKESARTKTHKFELVFEELPVFKN